MWKHVCSACPFLLVREAAVLLRTFRSRIVHCGCRYGTDVLEGRLMRSTFGILILLAATQIAFATQQAPDILHYDGLKIYVSTGWGHPSPLQTYYYQNGFAYPFQAHSTGNYRGHVATWKIEDGEFHLSEIQTDDYIPNPSGGGRHVVESCRPSEYGVAAKTRPTSENGDVFADWFSGILDCYVTDANGYRSYLFHVRDGRVVDVQVLTTGDYDILSDLSLAHLWNEDLRNKYRMLVLNDNYITYYYRLSEDDDIEYEGQVSRLSTGYERLSPLFGLYDNNHLNWPCNWENTEKSGAPHCQWRIEDDRLHLTGIDLYSGLSFYYIDTETLDLATLLGDRVVDGVVDANWVSGVYLIKHGYVTEEDAGWPGYTFTQFNTTGYTYIRTDQGRLTESYAVPKDFNPDDLPEDADPRLMQIIEDYRLPSVFDTLPIPTQEEAEDEEG